MVDTLIRALQLIGSLTAVALAWAAVVGYILVWPTEAVFGESPFEED